MKLSKRTKKVISIVGISILVLTPTSLYIIRNNLIKNHKVGQATITNCYWASRGTAKFIVEGVFKINSVSYKTSCQLKCQALSLSSLNKNLLTQKTDVVFNPTFPSINYLLLETSTYDLYNIKIPDSLKWIDSLVKCK